MDCPCCKRPVDVPTLDVIALRSLGNYSKSQVAAASGIGLTQVDRMRAVRLKLGNLAECFKTWKEARKQAEEPEEDRGSEEWKQQQAEAYAEKLAKAFGNKLSTNPELAAMALQIYFGRKLPDLYHQLGEVMTEDERQQAAEEGEDGF